MRKRYPKLLLLSFLLFASHSFAEGPKGKTVLITAFEPFDGRKENSSQSIAEEIAKNSTLWIGENVRVETCILPVLYNSAAEVAKRCYERMIPPPDLVLSLGEGSMKVEIEMLFKNENSVTKADNSGKLAPERIIDKSGPDRIFTTIPDIRFQQDKFTFFETPFLRFSSDAGNSVCNNTAYLLGRYFETQTVPYGLIHVPASIAFTVEDAAFATQISIGIVSKITKMTLDFYADEKPKRLKMVKTYFEEFQKANLGL